MLVASLEIGAVREGRPDVLTPAVSPARAAGSERAVVRDLTDAVASVSRKWRAARAERRDALVRLEGEQGFADLQRFLEAVHTLASERRLSRFMYLASKPPVLDA